MPKACFEKKERERIAHIQNKEGEKERDGHAEKEFHIIDGNN